MFTDTGSAPYPFWGTRTDIGSYLVYAGSQNRRHGGVTAAFSPVIVTVLPAFMGTSPARAHIAPQRAAPASDAVFTAGMANPNRRATEAALTVTMLSSEGAPTRMTVLAGCTDALATAQPITLLTPTLLAPTNGVTQSGRSPVEAGRWTGTRAAYCRAHMAGGSTDTGMPVLHCHDS